MKKIEVNESIKNGLLNQRNELIHYLKYLDKNQPETRSNCSQCSECDHVIDCCLIGKIFEPEKLSNLNKHQADLVGNLLAHLSELEIDFFKKMITLIYIEEKYLISQETNNNYWNIDSIEMEKRERGISKLKLEKIKEYSNEFIFKRSEDFKSLGKLPFENFCER